jgi:hypothetical protein
LLAALIAVGVVLSEPIFCVFAIVVFVVLVLAGFAGAKANPGTIGL